MTGQSAIPASPASGRVRPECTCVFTISHSTHACSSETTYAALTAQGQPEEKKKNREGAQDGETEGEENTDGVSARTSLTWLLLAWRRDLVSLNLK